jgi:hypothetical protein
MIRQQALEAACERVSPAHPGRRETLVQGLYLIEDQRVDSIYDIAS